MIAGDYWLVTAEVCSWCADSAVVVCVASDGL